MGSYIVLIQDTLRTIRSKLIKIQWATVNPHCDLEQIDEDLEEIINKINYILEPDEKNNI
jgi:hypothetical protein